MYSQFDSRASGLLNRIVVKLVLIRLNADFYIFKIPRELFISMWANVYTEHQGSASENINILLSIYIVLNIENAP